MSEKRRLSRAEIVRRRRAERMARELEQTAQRALKPIVPVTVRAPVVSVPAAPKRRENRRRYHTALSFPAIRISASNLRVPRLWLGWRLASALIALVLGALIYLALTLPYFYVPAATTLGNNRLTQEEINAALGVSGQSIFTIQPQEVRTRLLLRYPELYSAEVKVYLPNHVYVTVVERQPVIFWQQEGKGYTWVDASGVAFRPRGFVEGLIPVISLDEPPAGISSDPLLPTPYLQKELVDAILVLAPLVPAGSTLTFDSAHGLGWTDPRGWQAVFGVSVHDMPLKIRIYQSLVDFLIARRITPAFISVQFPNAPYYRIKEDQEASFGDSGQ